MLKQSLLVVFFAFIVYSLYTSRSKEPLLDIHKATEEEKTMALKWPIWTKEKSTFPYSYSQTEQFYVITGEVTLTTAQNKTYSFSAGDFVTIPKGIECQWNVKKDIKKHYNFK